ncbi:MAG TPA: FtsW/RodA/SpoVE family cell cycle protein [Candidatus Dojkabacteria bacterium]|nr:FtsW/RodA/SpoVE family cell cycle protein [Candidatus Dojkabacteria bacterium]HQF37224.1 FtsW/RodA/SpoVE family cell cycle protein [Candidatus Dojkabacteria bacterium]
MNKRYFPRRKNKFGLRTRETIRKPLSIHGKAIIVIMVLLLLMGLVFIYDASAFQTTHFFDNRFHFVGSQLQWIIIGFVVMFVVSMINYKFFLYKNAHWVIGITIFLLVLVLITSSKLLDSVSSIGGIWEVGTQTQVGGAGRWLFFTPMGRRIGLQPGEFAKIGVTLYIINWVLALKPVALRGVDAIKHHVYNELLIFVLILLGCCGLIILQPDMGTTMVIAMTCFIVYFISGVDKIHLIGSVVLAFFMGLIILMAGTLASYRMSRIEVYREVVFSGEVSRENLENGTGYQMQQILIGIGSGGWFGRGLGKSRQENGFLVENTAFTDSIIAVILEETGFVGGLTILLIYWIFIRMGYEISKKVKSKDGKLVVLAMLSIIAIQTLFHIGANVAVIPLTGIPLPFISYGGSSLLVSMIAVGFILSVDRYADKS